MESILKQATPPARKREQASKEEVDARRELLKNNPGVWS